MRFLDDAVCGRLSLPAIPRVVAQIVLSLQDPAVSMHAITHELEQDPTLAARTLQLVNSPYYGGRRSFASIASAVDMLGTDALQRMVMTAGLASVFVDVPGVNLRQFWHRATRAAQAARLICLSGRRPGSAEAAYLAALLHGIGHVILCQSFPAAAASVFTSQPDLEGDALVAVETTAFGLTHTEVGAAWVERLGFPTEIGLALRHYLAPWTDDAGELAWSLYLAVLLGPKLEAGMSLPAALAELDPALLERAGVQPPITHPTRHSPAATPTVRPR
jgi:HD-like signal output (HDOD) protein